MTPLDVETSVTAVVAALITVAFVVATLFGLTVGDRKRNRIVGALCALMLGGAIIFALLI